MRESFGTKVDDAAAPEVLAAEQLAAQLIESNRQLGEEVAQLRVALAGRAPIDQSKGIVMMRFGIDADTAFALLTRWSMNTNVKLAVIARALVKIIGRNSALTEPEAAVANYLAEALRRHEAGRPN